MQTRSPQLLALAMGSSLVLFPQRTAASDMLLAPAIFRCDDYQHFNSDLRGLSCAQAEDHWLKTGVNEGRRASALFHSVEYLSFYPDLVRAFGAKSYRLAAIHYAEAGMREGRAGTTVLRPEAFDTNFYYYANPDLRSLDVPSVVRHWVYHGVAEGRQAAPTFSSREYLALYPDLTAAMGTDYGRAAHHYINAGLAEGRRGTYPRILSPSILRYPVDGRSLVPPRYATRVGLLDPTDTTACSYPTDDPLTGYCEYSALVDTFAGDADPANAERTRRRAAFRADMVKYLPWHAVDGHPACQNSYDPEVSVVSFGNPYEYAQADFLRYLGPPGAPASDYLPPTVRTAASYGNQACPVYQANEPEDIARRFGQSARFGEATVSLVQDNSYYPWRWIAPADNVHAHEQPSMALLVHPKDASVYSTVSTILANAESDRGKRIVLDYDLQLTIHDQREALHEFVLWDVLMPHRDAFQDFWLGVAPDLVLADATDLYSKTVRNTYRFARKSGWIQRLTYLRTRYIEPTIQVSLQVNFKERENAYRLAEFMLASKNYRPSWTDGFNPTSNPTMDSYVPEGGNNGGNGSGAAWTRLRVDALTHEAFRTANPSLVPVRYGGEYYEIPDGDSWKHLRGTIDITDYYLLSKGHRFFPGTGGFWNGVEALPDPPTMRLGLEWIGIIFEVHGPFRVQVDVSRFDVRAE